VNIKVIMRNGDEVRMQSRGEPAKSWLNNVRRSGNKIVTIGTTSFPVADIMDAVDEEPRTGQTNLEGI
jgi:hypothetical protein